MQWESDQSGRVSDTVYRSFADPVSSLELGGIQIIVHEPHASRFGRNKIDVGNIPYLDIQDHLFLTGPLDDGSPAATGGIGAVGSVRAGKGLRNLSRSHIAPSMSSRPRAAHAPAVSGARR